MRTIVVKGDIFQASAAADLHGIPQSALHNAREVGQRLETVFETDAPLDTLLRWFIECPHVGGYPIGTLLWYGEQSPYTAHYSEAS